MKQTMALGQLEVVALILVDLVGQMRSAESLTIKQMLQL